MKYHPVGSSLLDEEPDRRSRGGWSHRLVALYYPLPASVSERASERFIVRTRTVRVWDICRGSACGRRLARGRRVDFLWRGVGTCLRVARRRRGR
jgi:hypothetical protein